jgi:hypothetical protein
VTAFGAGGLRPSDDAQELTRLEQMVHRRPPTPDAQLQVSRHVAWTAEAIRQRAIVRWRTVGNRPCWPGTPVRVPGGKVAL